ncbi:MAG: hypothetical protein KIS67_12595 [Verrucomicrobiae bacterium]|nr:hypothetical protein [Verrucomicrobiae bacterium]
MQTNNPTEHPKPTLPFIGRQRELLRLEHLHARRQHVLILGAAGVGKSALIERLTRRVPLLICPQSVRRTEIFDALENQLGLNVSGLTLIQRKRLLLRSLTDAAWPVVFDGVSWTTPRLSSFLEGVKERTPVWICARSEHSWDIGHIWPVLGRFAHVELRPFHLTDSRTLVAAGVAAGRIPAGALDAVERLHQVAKGNARVLVELLEGLASGHYDPRKRSDLKLLDLDRRIHQLIPAS